MPSATNVKTSILPAVVVTVGVPVLFHFTLDQVTAPLPVDAAWRTSKINDLPAVAVGIVTVHVVDAVSVNVCIVPLARFGEAVVVTVPIL